MKVTKAGQKENKTEDRFQVNITSIKQYNNFNSIFT